MFLMQECMSMAAEGKRPVRSTLPPPSWGDVRLKAFVSKIPQILSTVSFSNSWILNNS